MSRDKWDEEDQIWSIRNLDDCNKEKLKYQKVKDRREYTKEVFTMEESLPKKRDIEMGWIKRSLVNNDGF